MAAAVVPDRRALQQPSMSSRRPSSSLGPSLSLFSASVRIISLNYCGWCLFKMAGGLSGTAGQPAAHHASMPPQPGTYTAP